MRVDGFHSLALAYRGRDSQVYRAISARMETPVALKVMHNATGFDEILRVRDFGGAQGVVPLLDVARTSTGESVKVMPFYPDGSYTDVLGQSGPLHPREVVRVGRAVAGALSVMHGHGLLHNEIVPSNILRASSSAVLTDFGATAEIGGPPPRLRTSSELVYHAPPEVLRATGTSPASDVYELASVLWTLLAGHPPFGGDSIVSPGPQEYAAVALRTPASPVRRGDVPWRLNNVLLRALAKDPAERYATPGEFAVELERTWTERPDSASAAAPALAPAPAPAPPAPPAPGVPTGPNAPGTPTGPNPSHGQVRPQQTPPAGSPPPVPPRPETPGYPQRPTGPQTPPRHAADQHSGPQVPSAAPYGTATPAAPQAPTHHPAPGPAPAPPPAASQPSGPHAGMAPTPYPPAAPHGYVPPSGPQQPAASQARAAHPPSGPQVPPAAQPPAPVYGAGTASSGPQAPVVPPAGAYPGAAAPPPAAATQGAHAAGTGWDGQPRQPGHAAGAAGHAAPPAPAPPASVPPAPVPASPEPDTRSTRRSSGLAENTGVHNLLERIRGEAGVDLVTQQAWSRLEGWSGSAESPPLPGPADGAAHGRGDDEDWPDFSDPGPDRPARWRRHLHIVAAAASIVVVSGAATALAVARPGPGLTTTDTQAAGLLAADEGDGGDTDDEAKDGAEADTESAAGDEKSDSASKSEPLPEVSAPSNVSLQDNLSSVQVQWTDNSGGKASYFVVGGSSHDHPKTLLRTGAGVTVAQVTTDDTEAEYCFTIVAVDGRSAAAPEVCTNRAGARAEAEAERKREEEERKKKEEEEAKKEEEEKEAEAADSDADSASDSGGSDDE
ncbi:serine/threonine protein kinase [Nocardiopsis mwathae]|uniref:Serine/threonine protein kinase n=1 Tax=Nocardiopsis mwathae TaxID=1472723 RepID=A0A7X0D761_9ACTN|nr:serine/threonine protein kinase [Nocardiopsis mwathae]